MNSDQNITKRIAPLNVMDDERGLSTVEYVILLVLIAAACIGLWVSLGGKIAQKLSDANDEFDNVTMDDDNANPGNGNP